MQVRGERGGARVERERERAGGKRQQPEGGGERAPLISGAIRPGSAAPAAGSGGAFSGPNKKHPMRLAAHRQAKGQRPNYSPS